MTGAGDGIRTRDIDLGKVALYQLSYSRLKRNLHFDLTAGQLSNQASPSNISIVTGAYCAGSAKATNSAPSFPTAVTTMYWRPFTIYVIGRPVSLPGSVI
jgi:hypothetical protein